MIPLGYYGENDAYYHRIFCNLGPYEEAKEEHYRESPTHGVVKNDRHETESLSMEEFQAIMNERMKPLQVTASNPKWAALFRINERKANGFRRGRAFVMGGKALNARASFVILTEQVQMPLIAILWWVDRASTLDSKMVNI